MDQRSDLTVYDFGDKRLFVIDEPHVLSQEECLAILKPGAWIDISILQVWCK
jgi:hypothetical protein